MTVISSKRCDREAHGPYSTIEEIERANRDAGQCYFAADTMRFFKSRVGGTVVGGRLFVTSERDDYPAPRRWTVREAMPDGSITNVSGFQEYASAAQADRAVRIAARSKHDYYFAGRHGKNGRQAVYVVVGADDPWQAMARLRKDFRVTHVGRARDDMLADDHAAYYVKIDAARPRRGGSKR